MPISKSQSDNSFFRYRSQKFILQSAAYFFRKLLKSAKVKKNIKFSLINIKKKYFNTFIGKRVLFKVFDTITGDGKIESSAFNYLTCTARNYRFVLFKHPNQYYYLNLCIINCLYQAGRNTTHHQIPVSDKYTFFVKP